MKSIKQTIYLLALSLMTATTILSAEPVTQQWSFAQGQWNSNDWLFVHRKDMPGKPRWIQRDDRIENDGNHTSMVWKKPFTGDCRIVVKTSLADRMASSVILATGIERSENGDSFYANHIEIVLWDEGVNIWRLETLSGKYGWKRTAFLKVPLSKNTWHEMEIHKQGSEITVKVAGVEFGFLEPSLDKEFYIGITGSEGVVGFKEMMIEKK